MRTACYTDRTLRPVIVEVMDFLLKYQMGRDFIFEKQVRKKVMSQTKGLYPAPLKIIDVSRVAVDCEHISSSLIIAP